MTGLRSFKVLVCVFFWLFAMYCLCKGFFVQGMYILRECWCLCGFGYLMLAVLVCMGFYILYVCYLQNRASPRHFCKQWANGDNVYQNPGISYCHIYTCINLLLLNGHQLYLVMLSTKRITQTLELIMYISESKWFTLEWW